MDNFEIADSFSLLSKLMDIHGENSFKSRSYAAAAFAIEKLPMQLAEMQAEKIAGLKGIGSSTAGKIKELLDSGQLKVLDDLILNTPPGVVEMLNIKGIGPKKINAIWKEMEVESIGELLYACKENRLKLFKGFGEKTQQNVADHIEFYLKNKGSFLYAQVDAVFPVINDFLQKNVPGKLLEVTGLFRRQMEVITELEFIAEATSGEIKQVLNAADGFEFIHLDESALVYQSSFGIKIKVHPATSSTFYQMLVRTSSSQEFFTALASQFDLEKTADCISEEDYFSRLGLPFIPAPLRETEGIINTAKASDLPQLIQPSDIKGIIHSHSNWSDGSHTIEDMARAAIDLGLEYLVISDHSKSAFYANGLTPERLKAQHAYIDELNVQLHPFKIFKSIESDILNDGNLDYPDAILATFDLVIASVHSNLKMSEEKAMMRLLKAISNPFTTILGHMTGRLLLSRPGYPVDHLKIIEACLEHDVVIELNAHPNRLDMDWRFIQAAISKNVLISIDPDAHFVEGFNDVKYGILSAQKAMVSKENNLSSFSLGEFENFLAVRKQKKQLALP